MSIPKETKREKGKELFQITPILLGGDPVDPKNNAWLTREQHFEAVRYWNCIVRDIANNEGNKRK